MTRHRSRSRSRPRSSTTASAQSQSTFLPLWDVAQRQPAPAAGSEPRRRKTHRSGTIVAWRCPECGAKLLGTVTRCLACKLERPEAS